ncbi:MAG: MarR family transcriptional regulator [Pseudonocardia sp.]|nr:MarR family transcriptional regulator [Pseudonocardia sp.]MBO0877168.1 MarR family transcriptional regulator [Pseudonocardia sp.]
MTVVDPELTDAAHELRTSVMRLARRLRHERLAHGIGLTKMTFLSHLDRAGAATTSELAAVEGIAQQSAGRAVADLVDAGLLAREPDPRDGRQVLLRISPAGRELLVSDRAQRDAWLATAMAQRLTDVERELLVLAGRLLDRLAGPA